MKYYCEYHEKGAKQQTKSKKKQVGETDAIEEFALAKNKIPPPNKSAALSGGMFGE